MRRRQGREPGAHDGRGLPVPPGFVVCVERVRGGRRRARGRAARARPRARPRRREALVAELAAARPRRGAYAALGGDGRRGALERRAPRTRTRRASPASRRRTWTCADAEHGGRARRRLLGVVLQRARALLPRAQGLARRSAHGRRRPADGRAGRRRACSSRSTPSQRRRDQMVVEAVFGLGEPAVSGAVTPDNYTIDARRHESSAAHRHAAVGAGRRRRRSPLVARGRRARDAPDDQLAAWPSSAARSRSTTARPQDIEWAIAGGELYVLQSRPVTTL